MNNVGQLFRPYFSPVKSTHGSTHTKRTVFQQLLLGICLLLGLLQAGLLVYYAWYNFPTIDDYWYALKVQQFGVPGAVTNWYATINGRLGSNLLMSLIASGYPDQIWPFQLMPVALFVAVWFTGWWMMQRWYPHQTHWQKMLGACCFLGAWLLLLPDYYESVYWVSASVNYQWPWLFAVWGWLWFTGNHSPAFFKWAGAAFWMLAAGCNEVVAVSLVGTGLLLFFSKNKTSRSAAAALAFVAAVVFIAEVLAPGNQAKFRQTTLQTPALSPVSAIVFAYAQVGRYLLLHLVANPFVWVWLLVWGQHLAPPVGFSPRLRLFSAGLLWPLVAVPLLLAGLQQDYFPLRVTGFLGCGVLLWFLWQIRYGGLAIPANRITFVLALSLLLLPMLHRNWLIGWQEAVSGMPVRYHRASLQRLHQLRTVSADTVSLPVFSEKPFLLAPVLPEDNNDVQGYLEAIHGKTIQFIP